MWYLPALDVIDWHQSGHPREGVCGGLLAPHDLLLRPRQPALPRQTALPRHELREEFDIGGGHGVLRYGAQDGGRQQHRRVPRS